MPVQPIMPPPGVYGNGTEQQAAGRWARANRVRWRGGSMEPIGGWAQRFTSSVSNPRAMHTWLSLNNVRRIAMGSYDRLLVVTAANVITDITPLALVPGDIDAEQNFGYSGGAYGTGLYGTTRAAPGDFGEASVWSLDNYGQFLVACMASDGRALWWDLNTANRAVAISGAPTGNAALIVTAEDFLMLLGAGGDPRKVQWPDQQSLTVWAPAANNQAGDYTLRTNGQILQGVRVRGQTLILTDVDAHVATYQGPPFVYSFSTVSGSCSAVSRRCAVEFGGEAYWMGAGAFYRYNGGDAEEIPCEVTDYVFNDINQSQQSKVWAVTNSQFGEVWWFYPSSSSNECNRYVAYSVNENHWATGELSRLCGVDRAVFRAPIWADAAGTTYNHETGMNIDGELPWAESGPITLGNGDNVVMVRGAIADEVTAGDTQLAFRVRSYPNAPERAVGPYPASNPIHFRFSGRHVVMRIEAVRLADWRVGRYSLDIMPGGER